MLKNIYGLVLVGALVSLPYAALAQGPDYGAPISIGTAKKIAATAIAEARKNNFTMAVAIVDTGGNLVYFEKLDNTQIASIEVALAKARSANNYKRPTKVLEDAVTSGRTAVLGLPGAVPIEGGLPILIDGKIVGAIGVSGGTSPEDGQVAIAGLSVLKNE